MALHVNTLTIDCADPLAQAWFWSAALGCPIIRESEDEVMVAPSREHLPSVYPLLFLRNTDLKTTKNRLHFDLAPSDRAAEVERLEGMGARRVDIGQADVSWVVMADPEGNEFCVLRSLPADAG